MPGSTGCLRCAAGEPKCVAGAIAGTTCDYAGAASEGFHVLGVSSQLTCTLSGTYRPPATDVCATWKTGSPTVKLSLWVKGDCSIVVSPITDDSCSDPLKADYDVGGTPYTYGQLQMSAYYQTHTTIRSLLPSPSGSSYSRCAG